MVDGAIERLNRFRRKIQNYIENSYNNDKMKMRGGIYELYKTRKDFS
jgi:hypothetical protein